MTNVKIVEQTWVGPFRRFIELELRLTRYVLRDNKPDYAQYDVISPSGEVLFFVGGYFDQNRIGSTNGPFQSWRHHYDTR